MDDGVGSVLIGRSLSIPPLREAVGRQRTDQATGQPADGDADRPAEGPWHRSCFRTGSGTAGTNAMLHRPPYPSARHAGGGNIGALGGAIPRVFAAAGGSLAACRAALIDTGFEYLAGHVVAP